MTDFRKDPAYSITFNWFRFITIGVIPFILLVILNLQIYMDIRKRRIRKQRQMVGQSPANKPLSERSFVTAPRSTSAQVILRDQQRILAEENGGEDINNSIDNNDGKVKKILIIFEIGDCESRRKKFHGVFCVKKLTCEEFLK